MLPTKMIGNKIAEARKKINVSQAQLAQRLFISPQAVGKWERGESMPDITTFSRLAEILGVDLNYFSERFPSAVEATPADPLVAQPGGPPSGELGKKLSWDMSGGNWMDADFSGLKNLQEKFSASNMQRCKFVGSDMSGLLLKNNNVDSCDFSGSDLSGSRIQSANLAGNIFKDCSLKATEFSKSFIKVCDFSGADLTGAHLLKNNYVDGCDFSGSDMSKSRIEGAGFANSMFRDSSLKEAELSGSHFKGCDFSGANFTGAAFTSGTFLKNTVADAVWNRSSFIGMQLDDIVFEGTLEDCYFENCLFNWVAFKKATLRNTFFKNNTFKWIRLRFIDCQADRLTYELLKSGKADVTGITLLA